MSIPSKSDWGVIDKNNLDLQTAFDNFAGKSKAEARKMFSHNALYYQEDLMSMPTVALNYYAPEFAKYILSYEAKDDSDGASSFLYFVIELLESNDLLASEKSKALLISTANAVSQKQNFYDADVNIYGLFSKQYEQIVRLTKCT